MEHSLFDNYTGTIPHLFLCYIIDCIGAASCSHEELEQFINCANTFHHALKFTWTISDTSFPFLDLSISRNRLTTDIHFKPADSHNYVDHTTINTLPSLPLSAFCRDHSFHNSLISSTFPTNFFMTPGTFPCNCRRCYTCPYTSPLTSVQG
eukprot:g30411.t1